MLKAFKYNALEQLDAGIVNIVKENQAFAPPCWGWETNREIVSFSQSVVRDVSCVTCRACERASDVARATDQQRESKCETVNPAVGPLWLRQFGEKSFSPACVPRPVPTGPSCVPACPRLCFLHTSTEISRFMCPQPVFWHTPNEISRFLCPQLAPSNHLETIKFWSVLGEALFAYV